MPYALNFKCMPIRFCLYALRFVFNLLMFLCGTEHSSVYYRHWPGSPVLFIYSR